MRRQCCRVHQGQANRISSSTSLPIMFRDRPSPHELGDGGRWGGMGGWTWMAGWENTNFPDPNCDNPTESRLRLSPRSGFLFHHSSNQVCRSDSQIFILHQLPDETNQRYLDSFTVASLYHTEYLHTTHQQRHDSITTINKCTATANKCTATAF